METVASEGLQYGLVTLTINLGQRQYFEKEGPTADFLNDRNKKRPSQFFRYIFSTPYRAARVGGPFFCDFTAKDAKAAKAKPIDGAV